jgi:hypothetical protein
VENLVPQTARRIFEGMGCQGIVEKLVLLNLHILFLEQCEYSITGSEEGRDQGY